MIVFLRMAVILLLLTLTTTTMMMMMDILLEDIDGALRYDALPVFDFVEYHHENSHIFPSSGTGSGSGGGGGMEKEEWIMMTQQIFLSSMQEYKLGTPNHYLTRPSPSETAAAAASVAAAADVDVAMGSSTMPTTVNSGMPSLMPSSSGEMEAFDGDFFVGATPSNISDVNRTSSNNTLLELVEPNNETAATILNATAENSTFFHRNRRTLNDEFNATPTSNPTVNETAWLISQSMTPIATTTTNITDISTLADDPSPPPSSSKTGAPSAQASLQQPSLQPSPHPSHPPTKPPSVIPAITGEFAHHPLSLPHYQQPHNQGDPSFNNFNFHNLFEDEEEDEDSDNNHHEQRPASDSSLFDTNNNNGDNYNMNSGKEDDSEDDDETSHENHPSNNIMEHPFGGVFTYFDDIQLIASSSSSSSPPEQQPYVYFDSKQAQFGNDLGPRGNAVFVNLMLPPRGLFWGETTSLANDINDDVVNGDEDSKSNGEEGEVEPQLDVSHANFSNANVTVLNSMENATTYDEDEDDESSSLLIQLNNVTNSAAEEGTVVNNPDGSMLNTSSTSEDDVTYEPPNNTLAVGSSSSGFATPSAMPSIVPDRSLRGTEKTGAELFPSDKEMGSERMLTSNHDLVVQNDTNATNTSLWVTTDDATTNKTIMDQTEYESPMTNNETYGITIPSGNGTILDENTTMQGTLANSTLQKNSTMEQEVMAENIVSPSSVDASQTHDISDYFCVEDYYDWRIRERNASDHNMMIADNNATAQLEADGPPSSSTMPEHNSINEDETHGAESHDEGTPQVPPPRPLAILVKRGRCSFESKARMAMVVNELLRREGRSNRIEHLIVYNNGTKDGTKLTSAPSAATQNANVTLNATLEGNGTTSAIAIDVNGTFVDGGEDSLSNETAMDNSTADVLNNFPENATIAENNTQSHNKSPTKDDAENTKTDTVTVQIKDDEKLIDMRRVDQDGIDITVGLIYVTTNSGKDILSRIHDRQAETGVSPYLDLSMIFPDGSIISNHKSRNRTRTRILHGGSRMDAKYRNEGVEQQQDFDDDDDIFEFHDEQISHGWYFPATLTKFCLSCGKSMNYGFNDESSNSQDDGFGGIFPTELPPGYPDDTLPRPHHPDLSGYPGRGGRYTDTYIYTKPWLDAIRKMMIAILVLLLVGPFLLAARRWHTVGGTFRIAVDENGVRRLRIVSPNLEVFVNGIPDTVETNGMKLDRAQVFGLPEVEYVGFGGGEGSNGSNGGGEFEDAGMQYLENDQEIGTGISEPPQISDLGDALNGNEELATDQSATEENGGNSGEVGDAILSNNESFLVVESSMSSGSLPRAPNAVTPSRESSSNHSSATTTATGQRYASSTTCSICIDEFVPGELLRVLPRCNHAFHTECILPWLTERQGCCPMCKMPVLPEELQRSRRSGGSPRSRRGVGRANDNRSTLRRNAARGVAVARASRRNRPQSTPSDVSASAAASTERISEEPLARAEHIPLVSEIENDLGADVASSPLSTGGAVTPDGSPRSASVCRTSVPFGSDMSSSADLCQVSSSLNQHSNAENVDLIVLEQGVAPESTTLHGANNGEHDIGAVGNVHRDSHLPERMVPLVAMHNRQQSTQHSRNTTLEISQSVDSYFASSTGPTSTLPGFLSDGFDGCK